MNFDETTMIKTTQTTCLIGKSPPRKEFDLLQISYQSEETDTRTIGLYLFLTLLFLFLFLHLAHPHPIYAQQPQSDSLAGFFDEIVVTATRQEARLFEVPRTLAFVEATHIYERNYHTTPDALAELPGVHMQKTNLGGGSPFIRGLTGKQILILVDGIRLNNSTFRFGPNQYLNTVDPYVTKQMEVVFGPGSVLYGSDALGGVVNIRTQQPGEVNRSAGARVYQRVATAEQSTVTRIDVDGMVGKVALIAGGAYKRFGNLRAGSGASPVGAIDEDGVQPFTGYDEINVNAGILVPTNRKGTFRVNYFFTRQDDVPKSNNLIINDYYDTPDIENSFAPQQLHFGYLKFDQAIDGFITSLEANASLNVQTEGRQRRRAQRDYTDFSEDEITSLGAGVQVKSRPWNRQTLSAGIDLYHDDISSSGYREQDDGSVTDQRGRFPDGTTYTTLGAFLQDQVTLAHQWTMNLGLRFSQFNISSNLGGIQIATLGTLDEVNNTYSDLTWSMEHLVKVHPNVNLFANISRGFRAPNVDDLAVDGAWDSGRDVPNPDIEPEQVIQYEAGVKVDRGNLSLGLSLFENRFSDLIQRAFLDVGVDGEEGTGDDLFQFENVAKAAIRGGELSGQWLLVSTNRGFFRISGQASYIWGKSLEDDSPIRRIPPPLGRLGLRWDQGVNDSWIEAFARGALKQDRLSGGDIRDERIPEGGTPGWITLNLRGGFRLSRHMALNIGLENITNTRYRFHGSGIDAPGFNVVAGLILTTR